MVDETDNPCLVPRKEQYVLDLSQRGGSATATFAGTGDYNACYKLIKSMLRLETERFSASVRHRRRACAAYS